MEINGLQFAFYRPKKTNINYATAAFISLPFVASIIKETYFFTSAILDGIVYLHGISLFNLI
jgi:hypothetical protein